MRLRGSRFLGLWKILEYERGSDAIKVWRFQNYVQAKEFQSKREEFYDIIGQGAPRVLSNPLPEISSAEIELFKKILQTPEFLDHAMRTFKVQ